MFRLASTSFSTLNRTVLVEVHIDPEYSEKKVCPVYSRDTWMSPLIKFLGQGTLFEDRGRARKIQCKVARHALRKGNCTSGLTSDHDYGASRQRKEDGSSVKYTKAYAELTSVIRCWLKRAYSSGTFGLPSNKIPRS